MTICVSVKVSEGLVLAADSTVTVQGAAQDPSGNVVRGILKTYDHARKLSHVKDYPIGTLSWGIAHIGSRSITSLIKEYEYKLLSLREEEQKIAARRIQCEAQADERPQFSVQKIAQGLSDHVRAFYEAEFVGQPREGRPNLGILVSGYSWDQFFPEQWLIDLAGPENIIRIRPDANGKPDFGANWFGLTDAIMRLHRGHDIRVADIMVKRFSVPAEEILKLLAPLEYPVVFDGMPLQDAIDYAVYLVNVAIGRFRFSVGAPLCGGEIDVAVITPNTFTWVQRKSWKVRAPLHLA